MADASSTSIWATLVGVVIGGVLTIVAGWLGPALLESRKQAAEKKRYRAEKFEELVAAIYEFEHWIESNRRITAYGEEGIIGVSPFAKIQSISAVYFPQFQAQIHELDIAATHYTLWMVGAAKRRLSGNVAGMNEGSEQVTVNYVNKRTALLSAVTDFALTEFR
jgi:hypothetical protein